MSASPAPRLGISGRIAAFFQSAQITPLLALVAWLLGERLTPGQWPLYGLVFAAVGVLVVDALRKLLRGQVPTKNMG